MKRINFVLTIAILAIVVGAAARAPLEGFEFRKENGKRVERAVPFKLVPVTPAQVARDLTFMEEVAREPLATFR